MKTLPLATCGAPVMPVWVASHTGDSHSCLPVVALIAIKRQSPVPTYTLPSHTATPPLVRAEYEPLMARFKRTLGSNFQSSWPEAASTAYTLDCGALTYATPSTTIGSETMPMPLSMSRYHARPSPETLRSLICWSGLKCCDSKLRPLSSQFVPALASAVTRDSVTLPALSDSFAEVCEIRIIAAARHKVVTQSTFKRNPVETKMRDRFNTGHHFLEWEWGIDFLRTHFSFPWDAGERGNFQPGYERFTRKLILIVRSRREC